MTERLTLREEFEQCHWSMWPGSKQPADTIIAWEAWQAATERAARICEAELPGDEWTPCSAYDEGRYVEAKYLAAEIRGVKNEP